MSSQYFETCLAKQKTISFNRFTNKSSNWMKYAPYEREI